MTGIAVIAVAVFAGGFLTLKSDKSAAAAGPEPSFTLSTTPDDPGALFVGDSYAVGVGQADGTSGGFACRTAALLHWSCILDAEAGTGYLNDGHDVASTNGPYGERLAHDALTYVPDYIVITGGRFDPGGSATNDAAKAYVRSVQQNFPSSKLIVVAPFWNTADPPSDLLGLRTALKAAAQAADATFIDPLASAWVLPEADVAADGINPNLAGHKYLAAKLAAAITATFSSPSASG